MASQRAEIERTVERLIDEVATWPHVTVGEHRFGGTEFRVGPREIGHVHAWGMLDIAYLRALRDVLVDQGQTEVHHLLTESGWRPTTSTRTTSTITPGGWSACRISTTSAS